MWKTTVRAMGTACAIVLGFLAFSAAPEQLAKWKEYWDRASASVGVDWLDFWTSNGGRTVLLAAAILIGLFAWDVPQRLGFRRRMQSEPALIEEARRRKVREDLRSFLSTLYDNQASFAIGGAYVQADSAAIALRADVSDALRGLAANLLLDVRGTLQERIQPMLDARNFHTQAELEACLRAWGAVFQRYQTLVLWMNETYIALGISPWKEPRYREWRERDGRFIEAMQTLEHMEGCDVIVPLLREAGWGQAARPPLEAVS